MEGSKSKRAVGAVILAAGQASRMGVPKQLLRWKGKPLLGHALETALHVVRAEACVVVGGAYAEEIEVLAGGYPGVQTVRNPDWATGMGSSIACGVRALLAAVAPLDGILILLADQPLVQSRQVEALLQAWETAEADFVAASYEGQAGVPALFSHSLFSALLGLQGQSGAKALFKKPGLQGVLLPMAEAACDLDTPEEWERFQQEHGV
ncbi:MAG: NTP transferase domain-containing protein [Haliscomenobacter sp.]